MTQTPSSPLERRDRPNGVNGYLRLDHRLTLRATLAADGHVWAQLRGHDTWIQMSRPLASGQFIALQAV